MSFSAEDFAMGGKASPEMDAKIRARRAVREADKFVRKAAAAGPVPVEREGRNCFGLEWFASEADADAKAAIVKARGDCYHGGFFDGMACGRDKSFDYVDANGRRLYAVSVA